MITKAIKTDGISGSNAAGKWRLIMNADGSVKQAIPANSFSKTYSANDIVEVPLADLPDTIETQPEQIPDLLKGMVFAGDLAEEELLTILGMYKAWDDVEIGEWIEVDDLVSHENKLYQVSQRHQKQADWVPGVAQSLFTSVMPQGVIGPWEQRFAPPYYQVGDMVTYEGKTWVCTAGDANGNNVWAPNVFGWEEVTG